MRRINSRRQSAITRTRAVPTRRDYAPHSLRRQTPSPCVVPKARENARSTAVISTDGWAVYYVADVPILWAFCCIVERYLNSVPDADPAQVPLSLLFFEFSGF